MQVAHVQYSHFAILHMNDFQPTTAYYKVQTRFGTRELTVSEILQAGKLLDSSILLLLLLHHHHLLLLLLLLLLKQ